MMRVKVACINWGYPDAPHATSYIYDPARGAQFPAFHATWTEAMERAEKLAQIVARRDPTHGRIDRDIQEAVDKWGPKSLGQRVAVEITLQAKRDRGEQVQL